MLYYPLKNLRRDPHIFFKILLFCIIAHGLILVVPLMQNLVRPPKQMVPISFMPRVKGAEVKFKGNLKSIKRTSAKDKAATKNQLVAKKVASQQPVMAKKVERAVPVKKTALSGASQITSQNKTQLQAPKIKDGSSSKLVTRDKVEKKPITPKVAAPMVASKKQDKIEPIKAKEPIKDIVKPVEEQPVKAQKIPEVLAEPELQTMALDAVLPSNSSDEKDIPEWFTRVRDEIAYKILEYKFFKDIEGDFSYAARITINAQGKASISDEAGCAIPVVRSSIKKIYLEYAYPKTMWNKIWPISIEKQKLYH